MGSCVYGPPSQGSETHLCRKRIIVHRNAETSSETMRCMTDVGQKTENFSNVALGFEVTGKWYLPQSLQINSFQRTKLCEIKLTVFLFLFLDCHSM